jgi:predicted outer membrane repeat protein
LRKSRDFGDYSETIRVNFLISSNLWQPIAIKLAHRPTPRKAAPMTAQPFFSKHRLASALLAAGVTVVALPSHAAIFTVSNTNDAGVGSLRQALLDANAAAGADTVNITATGTITLTSGEILVSDGVTITGPGASTLTITTALNGRAIRFNGAGTSSISGVRFANSGAANSTTCVDGGALRSYSTNLSISQSVFANNTSGSCGGGALYFESGEGSVKTLTISDSTFTSNTAGSSDDGGALYLDSGDVTILRSVFTGNSCGDDGGAIYQSNGSLTVRDSVFTSNTAGTYGGAISRSSSSTTGTTITGSTFSGNSARNTSGSGGGAIYLNGSTTATTLIENSTFTGNSTAGADGSAIHLYVGAATLRNVTVSGNSGSAVGALRVESEGGATPITLLNTVITNTTGGPDISSNNTGAITFTGTNSLITNLPGVTLNGSGNLTGVTPSIGALANNGGLVVGAAGFTTAIQTMLPPTGSQLVNNGSNAAAGTLTTDQRGAGFSRVTGGTVDIGAAELGSGAVVAEAPIVTVPAWGSLALLISTLLAAIAGGLGIQRRKR